MAAALVAARLPRPQREFVDVVGRETMEFGSSGVRLRPVSSLLVYRLKGIISESRTGMCRNFLFRKPFSKRKVHIAVVSEGDDDITDIQELADGSLFFSFAGSPSSVEASAQPRAKQNDNIKMNGCASAHNLTRTTLPPRQPSSFRKKSPIPSREPGSSSEVQAATSQSAVAEDRNTNKGAIPSKSGKHERPLSLFLKKSPIPKERRVSSSKKSSSNEVSSAIEAPRKSKLTKRSSISKNRDTAPALTSEKKRNSSEASGVGEASIKAKPAVIDLESDSPFSSELKEILNHSKQNRKQTAGQATESVETSTAAPAEDASSANKSSKPSKAANVNIEVGQAEGLKNSVLSKDLSNFKLPELRSKAKARGLKGYSKLKKSELIDLIATREVT
ncbi:uncharacterized protein [Physcomitrium patens]|uniref:Rho termination factor-like N-terminal domain-containing protein n=1 Tax=Physcomitrium patens TaxID=3218 RepID=A0A2K1IU03_PHYPA|nr:rho-N domain-containing protein 1, chloroplastic-like isoform X1 [Physcomitrium patens]PNR32752.1 hypothetical protein PHYPA_024694 [Physcomitrium patens]|eukprot:XP_024357654.1 rho-N domain-containing protein 1, chloroplastic-like isoform X1 [Physcomitrella patens]